MIAANQRISQSTDGRDALGKEDSIGKFRLDLDFIQQFTDQSLPLPRLPSLTSIIWWMMKPGFSLLEIVTKSRIKEEKTLRVNLRLDGLCKEVPKTYHPDTWIERERHWNVSTWALSLCHFWTVAAAARVHHWTDCLCCRRSTSLGYICDRQQYEKQWITVQPRDGSPLRSHAVSIG